MTDTNAMRDEIDAITDRILPAAVGGIDAQQRARLQVGLADAITPLLATNRAAGVAFPDIGVDPLKAERPDDRLAASVEACREAYVRQQRGVPDQTALVWRWHLGSLLEAAQRLRLLQSRSERAASPPAPADATGEVERLREALEAIIRANQVRTWTATADNPVTHWEVSDGQFARMARAALNPTAGAR